jgi:hypothetical protein
MDTNPRSARPRRRLRLIGGLSALLLICLTLALVSRTQQGRAFRNVAEYRLRVIWWSLVGGPEYDPTQTGSLAGVVQDTDGAPLADAVVLVATVRGQVYQARGDHRGRYHIEGIPPGRYVPLAAAWGYEETTQEPVQVVAGRAQRNLDFVLPPYRPAPVAPTDLQIGPPQQAGCV